MARPRSGDHVAWSLLWSLWAPCEDKSCRAWRKVCNRERCRAQAKQLTQDEYAMNHPSGRIGKRLMLRVSDVMLTGSAVPRVPPQVRLTAD